MNYKAAILASSAGIALTSMPAYAQVAETPVEAADRETTGVGEIVVTAQRRSERLQDVPLTVASASEAEIKAANIVDATQIGKLVSGVVVGTGNTTLMPFIRGVGSAQRAPGAEASVATYIDGVYVPRLNIPMLRLFSINSIEVLKGPQGTLFGRNSSGGLINIITKTPEPGSEFTGTAELGYANYETLTVDGYAATGIGDKVGVDIAYSVLNQRKGWGFNRTRQTDTRKEHSEAFRSKLIFQPTDATRITLIGDYVNLDSDRFKQDHFDSQLQGYPANSPLRGQPQPLKGHWDEASEVVPFTQVHGWSTTARVEHEFSPFTVINTANYRWNALEVLSDSDFSEATSTFFRNSELSKNFTDEFMLQSNSGSRIKWTAGAYFGWIYNAFRPARLFGPALNASLGPGNAQVGLAHQRTYTYAGFGQVTVPLGSATNFTVGGRVTHDDIVAKSQNYIGPGCAPNVSPGRDCGFPDNPTLTPIPGSNLTGDTSYTKFSWRAAIDHHITEDVMLYASASSGMKSSTFSFLFMNETTPIKPEIVRSYEGGIKTVLLDHRVRFNVSGFYTTVRDLQTPVVIFNGVVNIIRTRNIPGLRSYGADVELAAAITDNFDIRANYTYTNAKYESFPNANFFIYNPNPPAFGNIGSIGDATGFQAERSPPHTFNVGANYKVPVGDDGDELNLNANYAFTSAFYWNPDNQVRQGSYGLLDAQIKFAKADPNVYIAVWGSNLTNEKYYSEVQQTSSQVGNVGVPAPPRTYGVKIGYNF